MMHSRMHAQDLMVPWTIRSNELGARPLSLDRGLVLFQAAWSSQGALQPFSRGDILAMGPFFEYVLVGADREVVHQNEYGDFMLVQLTGVIAVERANAAGAPVRMAQTHIGDVIGEMSLMDQGERFSTCVTLTPCDLAVLTYDGLEQLMRHQPHLAARMLLVLARKLSVRLRSISAKMH
ncbi:cyclic nucleotide-binding domain-containing protein [Lampropedia puyangensis]|nr:cyclic nucleotide-binding domain-containing protein [Lampropedia puyangensis]